MQKLKSSGAVIYTEDRERKYLLLHYVEGHWDFVKGKVENSESEIDALEREANEETGIVDLQIIPEFREELSYDFTSDGRTFHKDVVFFLAKTNQSIVRLSDEHIEYKWLNANDAKNLLTYKSAKDILDKAEKFVNAETK